jgi:dihydrofolate reductase
MSVPGTIGVVWTQAKQRVIGGADTEFWMMDPARAVADAVTAGHPVIIGRRTWDILVKQQRVVPSRVTIVITRDDSWNEPGAVAAHSFDDALAAVDGDEVWVVGGAQIFSEALGAANRAIVTELDHVYNGSAYAPGLGRDWKPLSVEPAAGWSVSATRIRYRTTHYSR